MPKYNIEYLPVRSASYGEYMILKLEGITVKELKGQPKLMEVIGENFGGRFVIVRQEGGKERDYFLNENIIGVPTPEFERQIESGVWKRREIAI